MQPYVTLTPLLYTPATITYDAGLNLLLDEKLNILIIKFMKYSLQEKVPAIVYVIAIFD